MIINLPFLILLSILVISMVSKVNPYIKNTNHHMQASLVFDNSSFTFIMLTLVA